MGVEIELVTFGLLAWVSHGDLAIAFLPLDQGQLVQKIGVHVAE